MYIYILDSLSSSSSFTFTFRRPSSFLPAVPRDGSTRQVLNVSQESKAWVADPANRICDAPGSWYCVGQWLGENMEMEMEVMWLGRVGRFSLSLSPSLCTYCLTI